MIRFFSIAFFVACTTTTAFGQTNTDTNKSSISMMAAYPLIDSNTLTVVNGKPDTSGTPDNNEEKVFERVEIEASFPGGDALWRRYLERNLDGSTPTKNGAPEGTYTVVVQFIVDKEGYIFDVRALTNHGYGMEAEVIRVIKKGPKWSPAVQDGRHVKAYRKQPVTFMVISEKKTKKNKKQD